MIRQSSLKINCTKDKILVYRLSHKISLCTHGYDRSSQSLFQLQEEHLVIPEVGVSVVFLSSA